MLCSPVIVLRVSCVQNVKELTQNASFLRQNCGRKLRNVPDRCSLCGRTQQPFTSREYGIYDKKSPAQISLDTHTRLFVCLSSILLNFQLFEKFLIKFTLQQFFCTIMVIHIPKWITLDIHIHWKMSVCKIQIKFFLHFHSFFL